MCRAAGIRKIPDVADVYIPQDLDYPALRLEIDRVRAGELGLSEKEVVANIITALTSNQMVAPNIWIDPKNKNQYFVGVQYYEQDIKSIETLMDANNKVSADTLAELGRVGYWGLLVEPKYGGSGSSFGAFARFLVRMGTVEPTIAVLTAPERISEPTTTTTAFKISRAHCGPTTFIARPPIRLPL